MDVKKIINEELLKFEEQQKFAYSIPDLAKLMERQGFDPEGQKILQDILMDAYRSDGDQGVIDKYAEISGVEIQAISRGRYVFDTLVGGSEPML